MLLLCTARGAPPKKTPCTALRVQHCQPTHGTFKSGLPRPAPLPDPQPNAYFSSNATANLTVAAAAACAARPPDPRPAAALHCAGLPALRAETRVQPVATRAGGALSAGAAAVLARVSDCGRTGTIAGLSLYALVVGPGVARDGVLWTAQMRRSVLRTRVRPAGPNALEVLWTPRLPGNYSVELRVHAWRDECWATSCGRDDVRGIWGGKTMRNRHCRAW